MSFISYSNTLTMGDILTAAAFLATLVAGIASLRRFAQTMKVAHYSELDKLYFDILKLGIDAPYVTEPGGAKARENAAAYGVYAFLMFNFLETIYDRVPGNAYLCRTWYPIIQYEYALHREWLETGNNRSRFKKEFMTFLEGGKWKRYC
jgi:hypothetical protein